MEVYNSIFEFFGHLCHQKPERSFFIKNKQLPVCARCTGILLGFLLSYSIGFFIRFYKTYWIFILFIPMVLDGCMQKFTNYYSNNNRRLVTGFLFGFTYGYVCNIINLI